MQLEQLVVKVKNFAARSCLKLHTSGLRKQYSRVLSSPAFRSSGACFRVQRRHVLVRRYPRFSALPIRNLKGGFLRPAESSGNPCCRMSFEGVSVTPDIPYSEGEIEGEKGCE